MAGRNGSGDSFRFGHPDDTPYTTAFGEAHHSEMYDRAVAKKEEIFGNTPDYNAERSLTALEKATDEQIEWFLNASEAEIEAAAASRDAEYEWLNYH